MLAGVSVLPGATVEVDVEVAGVTDGVKVVAGTPEWQQGKSWKQDDV